MGRTSGRSASSGPCPSPSSCGCASSGERGPRLPPTARTLTSPAWFSGVGTAPALELVNRIGVDAVYEHDVALANRFRVGLGLEPGNSAIVSIDLPGGAERLERAGIVAALRGGRLRASWHVYNTDDDVDTALAALTH